MKTNTTFRGIEHIGITVPDHAAAVDFFKTVFHAEVLFSMATKDGPPLKADALGPKNGLAAQTAIVAVSTLRFANGPNLEVFEIDHPRGPSQSNIANFGISHFSVTVNDIDEASRSFQKAGGNLLEGPYPLTDQEEGEGNMGRFGLTPWGLLIEFEQLPSPMHYDGTPAATRWIPEE